MAFLALEHKMLATLKALKLGQYELFLCVSGGADSVSLAYLLVRLRAALNLKPLTLVHIHHGQEEGEQGEFRDEAFSFVQQLSSKLKVGFKTNTTSTSVAKGHTVAPASPVVGGNAIQASASLLNSEAKLRAFRYGWIDQLLEGENPLMVLGHHEEDLLESRLIRLIRGTGLQGLQSMALLRENKLRPWLQVSKLEIESYLNALGATWLNDPSNLSPDPLRNWMRQEWLPLLEDKRPGASKCISRSLSTILSDGVPLSDTKGDDLQNFCCDEGLSRQKLMAACPQKQAQVLALFMNREKLEAYAQSHIAEVLKRLSNDRKHMNFRLLKRQWRVTEKAIFIE